MELNGHGNVFPGCFVVRGRRVWWRDWEVADPGTHFLGRLIFWKKKKKSNNELLLINTVITFWRRRMMLDLTAELAEYVIGKSAD